MSIIDWGGLKKYTKVKKNGSLLPPTKDEINNQLKLKYGENMEFFKQSDKHKPLALISAYSSLATREALNSIELSSDSNNPIEWRTPKGSYDFLVLSSHHLGPEEFGLADISKIQKMVTIKEYEDDVTSLGWHYSQRMVGSPSGASERPE